MTDSRGIAASLSERFGIDTVDGVHDLASLRVVVIGTPSLGDRSYVVHDGARALVVDPQRDIDRVLAVLETENVEPVLVADTHLHNDYLSGGLALARSTGAEYLVPAAADVAFDRTPVRDGGVLPLGTSQVRVLATPGHTTHHVAYLVETRGSPGAAFTGGSLLYGSVGRTDLVAPRLTETLARDQWRSAHRIAAALAPSTPLFPTHGFGSPCAASPTNREVSTVAEERTANPALTADEERFVRDLLADLDAYPGYYAAIGPRNAAGPSEPDLTPPAAVDPARLGRHVAAGEWVVDLRNRRAFQSGHLRGSLSFELDGDPVVYLAWMLPPSTPVSLLADAPDQVARFQRDLARVGIDRPAAQAVGGVPDRLSPDHVEVLPVATFRDLASRPGGSAVVVDVRSRSEWQDGHLVDAVHIPLPDLPTRLADLPPGDLWVHCATGFRATTAASLVTRSGRRATVIDDDVGHAAGTGLQVTGGNGS